MPGVIGNPAVGWATQAIAAKAMLMNLGAPISDLRQIDMFTFVESFPADFDVYWTLSNGAHEVHGQIKAKYDLLSGPASFLGLPVTDETGTTNQAGRFNDFDRGSIYWTRRTGPMSVHGPVRDRWLASGGATGPLGFPLTDQVAWRTMDPSVDPFFAWNLFEHGAVVTTHNVTDLAPVASIAPDQLRYLVHRAVDSAVHQLPDNIGLFPEVETLGVSDFVPDMVASKGRAVTFKLHGFHDNGLAGDTNFSFWFTLRFGLSVDATSFTDPWFRALQVELLPDSVGIDIEGISGWFVSGDDYKQKIEAGFQQHAQIKSFPVTTYQDPAQPAPPHAQVRLVIIDVQVNDQGGLDFLLSPESPVPGAQGSYQPIVQRTINDFVSNF
jgi:hypothetical protein